MEVQIINSNIMWLQLIAVFCISIISGETRVIQIGRHANRNSNKIYPHLPKEKIESYVPNEIHFPSARKQISLMTSEFIKPRYGHLIDFETSDINEFNTKFKAKASNFTRTIDTTKLQLEYLFPNLALADMAIETKPTEIDQTIHFTKSNCNFYKDMQDFVDQSK